MYIIMIAGNKMIVNYDKNDDRVITSSLVEHDVSR